MRQTIKLICSTNFLRLDSFAVKPTFILTSELVYEIINASIDCLLVIALKDRPLKLVLILVPKLHHQKYKVNSMLVQFLPHVKPSVRVIK